MPLLRVDAEDGRPVGPDGSDTDLATVFRGLPPEAPVMVMIHGYKYAPGVPSRCPHHSILALAPSAERPRRCLSWPRAMGFTRHGPPPRVSAIAFGWRATGTIWQAARAADRAGGGARRADRNRPPMSGNRPVHVLAHSLGARVALGALPALRRGGGGPDGAAPRRRVPLRAPARRSTRPPDRTAEIVECHDTRKRPLRRALPRLRRPPPAPRPALSAGLGLRRPNWLDIP